MSIRIVRLGTPRAPGEGLRVGTVRRPPRGVPKTEFASHDWYDVWYPNLAPSVETMKQAQEAQASGSPAHWERLRAQVQVRDGRTSGEPQPRPAGRAVAWHRAVRGLLLRAGVAVPPRRSAQPAGRARRGHRKLNTCRKIETTHPGIARYLNLFEAMPEVLAADRVTGED
jgi:hypothetical protein